jgi:hypothetical protein
MKRILFATLLVGCVHNADIGISNQPITCQPAAAGAANGTITNAMTHASFTFGSVAANGSLATQTAPVTVSLDDTHLALSLQFPCQQPQLGTFAIGGGQQQCPFYVLSTVSATNQAVYALGHSGTLILDENVGCLAGRYEATYGYTMDNGTFVDEGEIAGWFSVPVQ